MCASLHCLSGILITPFPIFAGSEPSNSSNFSLLSGRRAKEYQSIKELFKIQSQRICWAPKRQIMPGIEKKKEKKVEDTWAYLRLACFSQRSGHVWSWGRGFPEPCDDDFVGALNFSWRPISSVPKIGPWHQVLSAQLRFSRFPNKSRDVLGVAPVMCSGTRILCFLRDMLMRSFQALAHLPAPASWASFPRAGGYKKDLCKYKKEPLSHLWCPCFES